LFRQYTPKSTHGLNPDALGNVVQPVRGTWYGYSRMVLSPSTLESDSMVRDASRERGKKWRETLAKFSFRPGSVVATRNRIERKGDNEGSLAIKLHGPVQHPDLDHKRVTAKACSSGQGVARLEPSETWKFCSEIYSVRSGFERGTFSEW